MPLPGLVLQFTRENRFFDNAKGAITFLFPRRIHFFLEFIGIGNKADFSGITQWIGEINAGRVD